MNSPDRSRITWLMLLLIGIPGQVWAEPPSPLLDEQAMSARIDRLLGARWADKGVQPAVRADDAEFFRRLSLDLNGRIPSLTHLKDFLDDTRAHKRQIWVNKLMDGRDPDFARIERKLPERYVHHFTNVWRSVIFSQTTNAEFANLPFQLDPWLRRMLAENRPYDRMIAELLTQQGQPFYQANGNRPETIAGNAARVFLGVKLECAQCHEDRSGGRWTMEQFWEYAAFFVAPRPPEPPTFVGPPAPTGPTTIRIPGENRLVEARFLDGQKPAWKTDDQPRAVLAAWMTSAANPYFARAAVNRLWYHFFGIGLTDPVDFMGIDGNPPSHPELLDELASQFAAHQFDLKYLIRAITGSQAYQRTSARSQPPLDPPLLKGGREGVDDPRLFARMAPRGLTPEQLFDSVLLATGHPDTIPRPLNQYFGGSNPRAEFFSKFANTADKRTETQTSILQALYLMNNKFLTDAVEREGGCLDAIANASAHVPMTRRLEEMYLLTLSRKPRPEEMDRLLKYIESGSFDDRKKALVDVFWALLNSPEFLLNH